MVRWWPYFCSVVFPQYGKQQYNDLHESFNSVSVQNQSLRHKLISRVVSAPVLQLNESRTGRKLCNNCVLILFESLVYIISQTLSHSFQIAWPVVEVAQFSNQLSSDLHQRAESRVQMKSIWQVRHSNSFCFFLCIIICTQYSSWCTYFWKFF